MLNCILEAAVATQLLGPVSAADTAAASSAFVEIPDSEGQVAVLVQTGAVAAGSITYTFQTASDVGGTGAATIVPIGGALTAVTTSNDPLTQVAIFDPAQLKGWLKVIGTVVTGAVLVSYTVFSIPKYAS